MVTLATRKHEELASLTGYSDDLEVKIQTLNNGDCPVKGLFTLSYEQHVFSMADISEDYKGGQWTLNQGIWLLNDDMSFVVGNPNAMRDEILNTKSFSMFCSIAALNALAWSYHKKKFSNLANLAIYAYHRAYTQLEYENDAQADAIRSLLD